jgi:hypothetical protein
MSYNLRWGNSMDAKDKILYAIIKCQEELNGPNRYPLIPTIIQGLREMLDIIDEGKLDSTERAKSIDGLGKIVTDNYYFMQSDMGKAVADAMNEFRK